jgi:hypothetical protein
MPRHDPGDLSLDDLVDFDEHFFFTVFAPLVQLVVLFLQFVVDFDGCSEAAFLCEYREALPYQSEISGQP